MLQLSRIQAKAIELATAALFLCTLAACHNQPKKKDKIQECTMLDSIIRKKLAGLYDNPQKTHEELQRLASQQGDTAARCHVSVYDATALCFMGENTKADSIREAVLQWVKAHPSENYLSGIVWNHRGIECVNNGNIEQGCSDFEKACKMLDGKIVNETLINAYINCANANLHIGRPVIAAQRYRRALVLADSIHATHIRPAINCGLGQVYAMLENYEEAHHYLNLAANQLSELSEPERAFYFMTRGNCFFFQKQYEKAIEMFDSAYVSSRRTEDELNLVRSECNLGETYLRMGHTEQARPYLMKSLQYVRRHPQAPVSLRFYVFSMATELALKENRMADAERLLKEDVDTTGVDETRFIALHFYRLKDFYEKQHNWRQAYQMLKLGHHYDNSLKNIQTANNVLEIRSRYEQDTTLLQQKNTIMRYEARSSQQQLLIIGIILGTITLALIATIGVIVWRRRAERRYQAQVRQTSKLRMSLVQNRMQPHYIFNVLGTILPRLNNYPELSGDVGLLIDVLRGNLLIADKTAIPLKDERALVERFVKLHKLTHNGLPNVECHTDKSVPETMTVPAMCLQIPVENALKHAFSPLSADSRIDIFMTFENKSLTLRIVDNGCGYNPARIPQTGRDTGTGLRVLSRTINLLNARNTDQASLSIGNRKDGHSGTEVKLIIPTNYQWDI